MDETTLKQINALQLAVRVLDGSDGGSTIKEKYAAKLVLMDMILEKEGRKVTS